MSKQTATPAPSSKTTLSPELKAVVEPASGEVISEFEVVGKGGVTIKSPPHELLRRTPGFYTGFSGTRNDALMNDYTYVGVDAGKIVRGDEPFPMAIRAIKWMSNMCWVLFEQAPSVQNIFWSPTNAGEVDDDTIKTYSLPFPWTQFLVKLNIGKRTFEVKDTIKDPWSANYLRILSLSVQDIKFSTNPLVPSFRSNVKLYRPPLPNTYDEGRMCFFHEFNKPPSFVEALSAFINEFYGTVFNIDLDSGPSIFVDTKFKDTNKFGFSNRFERLFNQWSSFSVKEIIDPETIPFAPVADEKNYWKKHWIFSSQSTTSNQKIEDIRSLKLSAYSTDAKKESVLLKEHPDLANRLIFLESINQAVTSLFNVTTRNVYKTERELGNAQCEVYDSVSKTKPESTKVLSFHHSNSEELIAKKYRNRSGERGIHLPNELGNQPTYELRLNYEKVQESLEVLRKDTQTGPIPMPPGLRYWNPAQNLLVYERPPIKKTVSFLNEKKESAASNKTERNSYKIFVPWTQYWIQYSSKLVIQNLFATTSSVPMTHKDWHPGVLPLPNMYYESKVCLPNVVEPANSISELILHGYNAVWGSNYNIDLLDGMHLFIEKINNLDSATLITLTKSEKTLVAKLSRGFGYGADGFLKAWAEHGDPRELMKIIPLASPKSEYADYSDEDDFECTCIASEEPDEGYDCECCHESQQMPLSMTSMIAGVTIGTNGGWFKSKVAVLDSSFFSAYDNILLHAQAHQGKLTY